MTTIPRLRIDFVSDVACPWCAVGLAGLEQALTRLKGTLEADIYLQPFELNPDTPREGEDATTHLMRKYGIDATQLAANRAVIRERAAAVGFSYNVGPGSRIYNTFDAHRLLRWATLQDTQQALALKRALFRAFFTDNENVSDHAILTRLATAAGLNAAQARAVLASDDHGPDVRAQEHYYQQSGIHSVPASIVNRTFIVSGGQPPEAFERMLRQIASDAAWDAVQS